MRFSAGFVIIMEDKCATKPHRSNPNLYENKPEVYLHHFDVQVQFLSSSITLILMPDMSLHGIHLPIRHNITTKP